VACPCWHFCPDGSKNVTLQGTSFPGKVDFINSIRPAEIRRIDRLLIGGLAIQFDKVNQEKAV
jgi:hypothetical protein